MLKTPLSRHFILQDFLNGHTLYMSGRPFDPASVGPDALRAGRRFCEEVLEPIVETFGPISIANGYIPRDLLSDRWTPHRWTPEDGCAADIAVHALVNAGHAPVTLANHIVAMDLPFERFISYAGSEFVCLSGGRNTNRGVIYENERVPGQNPIFRTLRRWRGARWTDVPQRANWRRDEREPVYHTMRQLRPQHIKVGEYFTLLDFCRDPDAMARGTPWGITSLDSEPVGRIIHMARCVAEVLDPVVKALGHLSVTHGITRPTHARSPYATWLDDHAQLTFTLPVGTTLPELAHPAVTQLKRLPTDTDREAILLVVERFDPSLRWSSANPIVQPVATEAP
jgi:hypothetical protein